MKNLIVISAMCILFSSSNAFGQKETPNLPIDGSTGKITYSEVVTLNGNLSKNELFGRAKTCFVNVFKDSKEVIQNEDQENGTITGKGIFKVYARAIGMDVYAGNVNFTLTIAVKDGKYKYIITDLNHEGNGVNLPSGGNLENGKPKGWTTKVWNGILSQTDEETKNLISSIKIDMNKTSPKNDNW